MCIEGEETILPTSLSSHDDKETDERLLAEDSEDETEDESDEGEVAKFLMLMNKAEKKTMKRLAKKQNQFGSVKSNWRSLQMEDPDEESTDTEDEDDYQETTKFLSLIEKAKQKNTKVSIKWVNGQVRLEKEQEGLEGNSTKSRDMAEFKTKGKRKFEDRMTLNEAKAEDFNDSQDYVNFIQTKLQGVRIKLTK